MPTRNTTVISPDSRESRQLSAFSTKGLENRRGRAEFPRRLLSLVLALFIFLPGCAVGPTYRRPKVIVPGQYRGAEGAAQQASFADLAWWEVFKDERLKELIQTALANNYDLLIAVSRVEQSRQISAQARAQYFPFVNYSSTGSDGKNEFAGTVAPNGGVTRGTFVGVASAAWEADVWGRLRRLNESARAQYLATEEGRRGVMLSLVSDMAQDYFQLLGLELQLDIARQTTDSYNQTLKLFTEQLEGGVASKLQTSRAAGAAATAAASIPQIELQIALTENQISILLGSNPSEIKHTAQLLDEIVPPEIPAGLPSALLERRPDVLQAEQLLRSANAQVGVATANYFPQIGLTALFGRASTPLSTLSSGQTTISSVAGNVTGPIFQGGALRAQKRQAVAFWEQSKLQYEQTALSAFQDVSNALISRQKYELIRAKQIDAVQSYQESVKVSLQRYLAGKANYYEVLEAQQQLYPAQLSLAETELNRRTVIVQLYKALGGGWNLKDPDWAGPKSPASSNTP
ncbi:MAG TPA: efflux transporter outer membrane subunit [Terriglobales bacterium]|nr:efflux transporter outer membrane subunit [Terriglobales bacterium]